MLYTFYKENIRHIIIDTPSVHAQAIAASEAANDFAEEEAKTASRGERVMTKAFDAIVGLDAERREGGSQKDDGQVSSDNMKILSEGLNYADSYTASKCLVDDGDDDGHRWLTPDGKPSWFIVDLGSEYTIRGYRSICNTRSSYPNTCTRTHTHR